MHQVNTLKTLNKLLHDRDFNKTSTKHDSMTLHLVFRLFSALQHMGGGAM